MPVQKLHGIRKHRATANLRKLDRLIPIHHSNLVSTIQFVVVASLDGKLMIVDQRLAVPAVVGKRIGGSHEDRGTPCKVPGHIYHRKVNQTGLLIWFSGPA